MRGLKGRGMERYGCGALGVAAGRVALLAAWQVVVAVVVVVVVVVGDGGSQGRSHTQLSCSPGASPGAPSLRQPNPNAKPSLRCLRTWVWRGRTRYRGSQ